MDQQHPVAIYRQRNSLSQKELGEIVGCGRWTINRIEAGEYTPSVGLLLKLAEATGLSTDEILIRPRSNDEAKST